MLYHLTKLGWSDVMLIERSDLTSGSTWHAAGGFHTLNGDTNMAALQGYTIRLYRELEALTGMSCGLHHVGGITLADGKLIVLTAQGELMVLPALTDAFQPTARAQVLGGTSWTAPVLANGRIYCRNSRGDIVCLDVRKNSVAAK